MAHLHTNSPFQYLQVNHINQSSALNLLVQGCNNLIIPAAVFLAHRLTRSPLRKVITGAIPEAPPNTGPEETVHKEALYMSRVYVRVLQRVAIAKS